MDIERTRGEMGKILNETNWSVCLSNFQRIENYLRWFIWLPVGWSICLQTRRTLLFSHPYPVNKWCIIWKRRQMSMPLSMINGRVGKRVIGECSDIQRRRTIQARWYASLALSAAVNVIKHSHSIDQLERVISTATDVFRWLNRQYHSMARYWNNRRLRKHGQPSTWNRRDSQIERKEASKTFVQNGSVKIFDHFPSLKTVAFETLFKNVSI